MADLVVIGFGNTLRRDDALGPLIADEVARWKCPDILALAVPQLLPELTETLVSARQVIFVDAALCDEVQLQSIDPAPHSPSLHHTGDPRWLLALTQALHGRCPDAWFIRVPAVDLGFGDELSPVARRGLADALRLIEQRSGGPRRFCQMQVMP